MDRNDFIRHIPETLEAIENEKKQHLTDIEILTTYKDIMQQYEHKQFNVKIKEFVKDHIKYTLRIDTQYYESRCYRFYAYELDENDKFSTGRIGVEAYFHTNEKNYISYTPLGKTNEVLNYNALCRAIDSKIEELNKGISKLEKIDEEYLNNVCNLAGNTLDMIATLRSMNLHLTNKTLCGLLNINHAFDFIHVY